MKNVWVKKIVLPAVNKEDHGSREKEEKRKEKAR